jgi:hypothetical protein
MADTDPADTAYSDDSQAGTRVAINFQRERWSYDPQVRIAPAGGFASVFQGGSTAADEVAVKRFRFDRAQHAHREIQIATELIGQGLPARRSRFRSRRKPSRPSPLRKQG